jgi:hypothetical protein
MAYIGNEPIVSATRTVTEITATAGQTTFTANGGYTVGKIDVIVNGAQLQTSDFTATDGSTVVLAFACTAGDDVRLVAWGTFSVNNLSGANLNDASVTDAKLVTMTASKLTGTVATDRLPAGTVLQVVTVNSANTTVSTTSGTPVSSGITVTITPKRANSYVRIDWAVSMAIGTGGNLVAQMYYNGSNIAGGTYNAGFGNTNTYVPLNATLWIAAGNTNTQTFTVYFYNTTAGNTAYLVHPGGSYSLTATEIAQ